MVDLDLVVLFADADAQRFVTTLIERGIERGCLRQMQWRSVRDPMHDARVAREPTAALAPFLGQAGCRFVVLWDHQGSSLELEDTATAEAGVSEALTRAGLTADRVAAIAFQPELEVALMPVWPRVLEELGKQRGTLAANVEPDAANPKGAFAEALRVNRLRASPRLFAELAGSLSLEALKNGDALGRLAAALVAWFGAGA